MHGWRSHEGPARSCYPAWEVAVPSFTADEAASHRFLVVGIATGLIASCITFYTMSKFDRRTLILFSMTIITIVWTGIGISGAWQDTNGAMW